MQKQAQADPDPQAFLGQKAKHYLQQLKEEQTAKQQQLKEEQAADIENHWNGSWLMDSPQLQALMEKLIDDMYARIGGDIKKEQVRELAFGLATTISLSYDNRQAIIAKLSKLVLFQSISIFAKEKRKFPQLAPKHSEYLLTKCHKCQQEFLKLLAADHILVFTAQADQLRVVWSGMQPGAMINEYRPWPVTRLLPKSGQRTRYLGPMMKAKLAFAVYCRYSLRAIWNSSSLSKMSR